MLAQWAGVQQRLADARDQRDLDEVERLIGERGGWISEFLQSADCPVTSASTTLLVADCYQAHDRALVEWLAQERKANIAARRRRKRAVKRYRAKVVERDVANAAYEQLRAERERAMRSVLTATAQLDDSLLQIDDEGHYALLMVLNKPTASMQANDTFAEIVEPRMRQAGLVPRAFVPPGFAIYKKAFARVAERVAEKDCSLEMLHEWCAYVRLRMPANNPIQITDCYLRVVQL